MADERIPLDNDPNAGGEAAALEQEARETAWLPKDEYKGDPERWVPPDAWLERGRELAPLIKAQNKGLKADLERERQARLSLEAQLMANNAALAELQSTQDRSVKDELAEAIVEVKDKIKQASEANDYSLVADLTEQLTDLKLSAREAVAAERTKPKGNGADAGNGNGQPQVSPAFNAWYEKNRDWYGVDLDRTDLVELIGKKLVRQGLKDAEFYTAVDREMAKQSKGSGVDRYGSPSTGSSRSGTSLKKGYSDLPADARRDCDSFKNQLVGPAKKHKTLDAWRQRYADQYFAQE